MDNIIHKLLMERPAVAGSDLLKFKDLIDFKTISEMVESKLRLKQLQSGFPVEGMIKATFLSNFFYISDRDLERKLQNQADFGIFCGMYHNEDFPGHMTLCKFRNDLVDIGLLENVFNEINAQLEAGCLDVKNETIVVLDATFN